MTADHVSFSTRWMTRLAKARTVAFALAVGCIWGGAVLATGASAQDAAPTASSTEERSKAEAEQAARAEAEAAKVEAEAKKAAAAKADASPPRSTARFGDQPILERLWRRPLGSGYSGVAMADDLLVTAFSRGDSDWVAAFRTSSAEPLWRFELGPRFDAPQGSFDGPLSTPVLAGDSVYAFSPRGRLVALGLRDGSLRWESQLDTEASPPPHFGYTTTPVVEGDRVFLATGGDDSAVTAFSTTTGEVLWRHGSGKVSYQSPALLRLAERVQLVVPTDRALLSLDPEDGALLWSLDVRKEAGDSEGMARLRPVDGDRLLLGLSDGSVLVRVAVARGGRGFTPSIVWRSSSFGRSVATPVVWGDAAFGYSNDILTAVSLDDGELLWRRREPTARNLTLVDGHLAIVDKSGTLILAAADPEAYREVARVVAIAGDTYTAPTQRGRLVAVRNFDEMSLLRVSAPPAAE